MMKKQASYKTRGMSNGQISQSKPQSEEEKTNQKVIIGVVGVGLLLIVLLYLTFGGSTFRGQSVIVGQERISQLSEDKRNIPIEDKYVSVLNQKIFYRECNPVREVYHRVDLLFLHGQKYSSSTWKGLGTLQIFASYGYRSVAVDLPGFGLSKNGVAQYSTDEQRVAFIESFVNAINLRHVVIVAPSKGGDYGIPTMIASSMNRLNFELQGLIAIAPTGTEKHNKNEYQKVDIPVLILWGERDRTDIVNHANFYLPNIPDSVQAMVPKAQHAAFVGNPQAFHTYILNFLQERCTLTKEDYDDDFDFGSYDWYASDTSDYTTDDYDYDLASVFDSFTDSMSYNYEDDDFFLDDQFDSDTYDFSDDYTGNGNTNSDTSGDTSGDTSDDQSWFAGWGK